MAEIKSTLDLIMEKTAGLVMSDQEKEKNRGEEREKKARGVALRLSDGTLRLKDLEAEISGSGGRDPEGFRRLVSRGLVQEADLGRVQNGAAGPGAEETLAELWPAKAEEIRSLFKEARKAYGLELAKAEALEARKVLDQLRKRGIYGSALRPVVRVELDQEPFKATLAARLS